MIDPLCKWGSYTCCSFLLGLRVLWQQRQTIIIMASLSLALKGSSSKYFSTQMLTPLDLEFLVFEVSPKPSIVLSATDERYAVTHGGFAHRTLSSMSSLLWVWGEIPEFKP